VDDLGGVNGVPGDVAEEALDWLEEVARRANAGQLPVVARRIQHRALDLPGADDPVRRARLLVGRAAASAALRQLDDAEADLDEVDSLLRDRAQDDLANRSMLVRGDLLAKRGEGVAAAATLEAVVDRFGAAGDRSGEAEALRLLCLTLLFDGRNDDAEAVASQALEVSRSVGDRRAEAWALQHLAWISFVEGRVDEAGERVAESRTTFGDLGDEAGRAWADGLHAFLLFHLGHFDDSAEVAASVLEAARVRDDRWGEAMMRLLLSGVALWSGRTAAGVDDGTAALDQFRAMGDRFGVSQATVVVGRALVTLGEVDRGLELLRGGASWQGSGAETARATVAGGTAAALVQVGEPEQALEALGAMGGSVEAGLGGAELVVTRALALAQLGHVEQSVPLMDALVDLDLDLDLDGRSSHALAVGALVAAAAGAPLADVAALDDSVRAAPRATYLDRLLAGVAAAVVRVGAEGADAVGSFEELARLVEPTGDAVARAVLVSARAAALRANALPGEDLAASASADRWAELGLDGAGWRTLFDRAAHAARRPDATVPTLEGAGTES
jgi:tetratricopeptide (TPR) repeat protein